MTQIVLDQETLEPLIDAVVQRTLAQCRHVNENGEERLAWSEKEAAELLGMKVWVLRDLRLDGAVQATQIGRRWFYTKDQLMELFRR